MQKKLIISVRDWGHGNRILHNDRKKYPPVSILSITEEESRKMVQKDYELRWAEAPEEEKDGIRVRTVQEIMDELDRLEENNDRRYYRHNRSEAAAEKESRHDGGVEFRPPFGDKELLLSANEFLDARDRKIFNRIMKDGSCTRYEFSEAEHMTYSNLSYRLGRIRSIIRGVWFSEE